MNNHEEARKIKRAFSRKYLGKHHIHGVGLCRGENGCFAIDVHLIDDSHAYFIPDEFMGMQVKKKITGHAYAY